jgi:hypothetical protein
MNQAARNILFYLLVLLLTACSSSSGDSVSETEEAGVSPSLPAAQISQMTAVPVDGPSSAEKADPPTVSTPVVAAADANAPIITVDTDRTSYGAGDDIQIEIRNYSPIAAYPVAGDSGCVSLTIQKKQDDEWGSQDLCLVSSGDGGSALKEQSWEFVITGPALSDQPTGPVVFDGDIRDLPTITPHPPGYSGPEVPRGPSGQVDPQSDAVRAASLGPGTYRIGFVYYQASIDGIMSAVYSPEFIVS